MRNFTGREVVVRAGGVAYRGKLVEMTETAVILKMESGFCEIPMGSVAAIEPAGSDAAPRLSSPSPLAGARKRT